MVFPNKCPSSQGMLRNVSLRSFHLMSIHLLIDIGSFTSNSNRYSLNRHSLLTRTVKMSLPSVVRHQVYCSEVLSLCFTLVT